MPDPLVTTIEFDDVTLLVDRRGRTAFLMSHDAEHLGAYHVAKGRLLWFGIDSVYPPLEITRTVHSMIGGKRPAALR